MSIKRKGIQLIGACCKYGQKKKGVEIGPQYISNHFSDYNLKYVTEKNNEFDYKKLYNEHNRYIQDNKVITIGGDHSISLATVASAVEKYKDDLTVIWVDAHADINTRISSISKNIHGMPVASLIGTDNIFNFPQINPEKIIYIGLRDLDDYEMDIIKKFNIKKYDIFDIKFKGIENVIKEIKEKNEIDKVHISFDVDVLDPKIFPSTGTPVENGLQLFDAYMLLGHFKNHIVSADFVEFNPLLTNNKERYDDSRKLGNLIKYIL